MKKRTIKIGRNGRAVLPKERKTYTRAHRLMMHLPDFNWVVNGDWEFQIDGKWKKPMTLDMAEKFLFAIDIPVCMKHEVCKAEKLAEIRARVKAEGKAS